MNAFEWSILDFLAKSTLILATGLGAYIVCRRFSAANRHLGLRFVSTGLLLLPFLTLALPAWELRVLPADAPGPLAHAPAPALSPPPVD